MSILQTSGSHHDNDNHHHSSHHHGNNNNSNSHNQDSHHNHKHIQHQDNNQQRILLISFAIITGFMLVEAVGGWLTGSLALLSDAGHMLSDAVALGATLLAFKIGEKTATKQKTFGYRRFEILVAGVNGATLVIISLMIIYEAFLRFWHPEPIASQEMLIIATIGMLVNILVAWLLHRSGAEHSHIGHSHANHSHSHIDDHTNNHSQQHVDKHAHSSADSHKNFNTPDPTSTTEKNLNMQSAYLHVLGDLLGSVAAIIAAVAMIYFGWWWADPVASLIVSALILFSGYRVVRDSVHILMEGTPNNMSLATIEMQLRQHPQVQAVHDLHVWSITSGLHALSCHVMVNGAISIDESSQLIQELETSLQTLGINHSTIQIESQSHPQSLAHSSSLVCDITHK
ncbi:cation diffusion facilitator family transporter [Psychrobacter sp. I-STPA10]|uniref:cation diffusion facilitator family transporter n=1 Tax=Psychrobacter sp. I-STPA10 TaxID=2585769 RepID=UPI001E2B8FB1|nr:cation diffusion facilitator family transporter [Psychrobacter sp. I-STPA10]